MKTVINEEGGEMDKKFCMGCRNDFYNGKNDLEITECWSFKEAKTEFRIPIGYWEPPPYKNKKKVRVAVCWEGLNRTLYVHPSRINSRGYWT